MRSRREQNITCYRLYSEASFRKEETREDRRASGSEGAPDEHDRSRAAPGHEFVESMAAMLSGSGEHRSIAHNPKTAGDDRLISLSRLIPHYSKPNSSTKTFLLGHKAAPAREKFKLGVVWPRRVFPTRAQRIPSPHPSLLAASQPYHDGRDLSAGGSRPSWALGLSYHFRWSC